MMNNYSGRRLLAKAERIGPATSAYLKDLLRPHAMRNLRKAQGIISLADTHPTAVMEAASRQTRSIKRFTYKGYQRLLEARQAELPIPISNRTQSWVRPGDYFSHSENEK